MRDVLKLGCVEASFQAEKPLIDLDSVELTFTICAIMKPYEKRSIEIKKVSSGN